MGQGARTIFAQLAADELGASLEKVSVVMGDTSVVPFDLQTSASRSTVFMGTAICRACEDIREQLREMAAELLGLAKSDVRVAGGMIELPHRMLSIAEFIAGNLGGWNGELIGRGRVRKPVVPNHPLGGTAAFFEFNCTAFEVEVDTDPAKFSSTSMSPSATLARRSTRFRWKHRMRARPLWGLATA
jgi:CO/xanthine dehydrogenase Mo-binding subunit